ncbi:hypothetical protein [Streptomyces sp. TRM68367]|uniref:hypothetical protein n=1 Tax=Streptomyces sp. TRM68367 TaxID=2758415 RepID=UPI00165C3A5F|nr:hypothetical protein [Streptomyces sp. TRM68367]MBC9729887.1 hypothetical protein [Streptomyces sp. TRM68367]
MADVLIAGALGAALLALAVMYRMVRRNTGVIAQLRAEVNALKIAALTAHTFPADPPEEQPEPARRKRHLALYIGGGVAAIFTTLGTRLRTIARRRRAATVTAAAGSVLVASTAAALYVTGSEGAPAHAATQTHAPVTVPDSSHTGRQGTGDEDTEGRTGSGGNGPPDAAPSIAGLVVAYVGSPAAPVDAEESERADGATSSKTRGEQRQSERTRPQDATSIPGSTAPADDNPPAQDPTPTATPTAEPPTTDPEPEPEEPPTSGPQPEEPPSDGTPGDTEDGRCLTASPLLDLCLTGGR